MSLTRREQILGLVTLLAILFGGLGLTLRGRLARMREQGERLEALRRQRASERELIGMGAAWRERYEAVRDQMPVFEPGRQVDTYWLSRMDALADQYGVRILRRQVGREQLVGDVYEFSIECREWEGTLDAFVRFLHAMQAEGAMLDVRDLLIRPHASAAGVLRGSFTLFCAYMRGAPVAATPAAEPAASPPPAPRGRAGRAPIDGATPPAATPAPVTEPPDAVSPSPGIPNEDAPPAVDTD